MRTVFSTEYRSPGRGGCGGDGRRVRGCGARARGDGGGQGGDMLGMVGYRLCVCRLTPDPPHRSCDVVIKHVVNS